MKRREVIKRTAALTGVALGAPLLATLLSGCKTDTIAKIPNYSYGFFKDKEQSLLVNLIDLILPRTNSPSASDVGVHKIIDSMVANIYDDESKKEYRENFDVLQGYLIAKEFDSKNDEEKESILLELMNEDRDHSAGAEKALLALKQQTVSYYLSTEEVGTEFLTFLPVPGKYQACMSVEEAGGKAWAI